MLRKAAIVLAAATTLALPIATSSTASARPWHHGWHHGGWHHGWRHHGWRHHGWRRHWGAWAFAPGYRCWRTRRVWTAWGWRWRRVNVCY